jgi:hypothetical protein
VFKKTAEARAGALSRPGTRPPKSLRCNITGTVLRQCESRTAAVWQKAPLKNTVIRLPELQLDGHMGHMTQSETTLPAIRPRK